MMRVSIRPALMLTGKAGERLEPQLLPLLRAIHREGKLTLATRRLDISYRYAWDLLEKWAKLFGDPLVRMERGKGAQLTCLGRKFLWAEERIAASSLGRLESIAAELNAEIENSRGSRSPQLRIHASHGYAVAKLPELMRKVGSVQIELRHMGSEEALTSLSRGQCDLAGFHLPLDPVGSAVWKFYSRKVHPARQRIIRMITREQGLMLARGNPLKIRSIRDLARRDLRFVNRQPGSGTRLLLEALLAAKGIDPAKIQGFAHSEFTHAAVAAFIASGAADVGFGVEPAARQFGLDFISVAEERYMLVCNSDTLDLPSVKQLIGVVRSPAFLAIVTSLPGSKLDNAGTVCTFADVLSENSRKIGRVKARRPTTAGKPARSAARRSAA